MRIIAGEWRGRRLRRSPGSRPTSDRVREALFSIWQLETRGAHFLDAFSGAGAVGLEAASRGAAHVTFLDHDAKAIRLVTETCHSLGFERYQALRVSLPSALSSLRIVGTGQYDLVFADPPYDFSDYEPLVLGIADRLAPGGLLGVEHAPGSRPEGRIGELECYDSRSYGSSSISFFRRTGDGNQIKRRPD